MDEFDDIEFPADATEESLAQLVQMQQQSLEMQQQSQQQIAEAMQRIAEMQERLAQTIVQGLQQIARSQQQVMMAISAPRRRIAVRDGEGRITEAHDVPMAMQ